MKNDLSSYKLDDFKATKSKGIKIHKSGLVFLFDFRVDGKRYRIKWKANPSHSPSDKLRTAQSQFNEVYEEKKREHSISADVNATVGDYWVKVKKLKNWKPYMVEKYNYYYNKHLMKLDPLKIKDVKPAHITELNISLQHLKPSTIQKAYEILKPIFNLAIEDEIIVRMPIKDSHLPKRKQIEEKKVITDAVNKYKIVHGAIHRLFNSKEIVQVGDKKIKCSVNKHHLALFLFGFHGRRRNETTSLQWEDIDFNNDKYIVRAETSKINTDMVFSLPSEIKEALKTFRDTTGNVFNVKKVYKHYDKIRLLTGIEEFSYHWMRNLAVSALSSTGASLTDLTAMLGHQDSTTLKKYLSLQRDASTKRTDMLSAHILKQA
ncbi:site-specific integrase [Sulfurimonas sp. NW15]|uniref:tyrosine-type recombinase/integrase n=1 Tax=Sulfurimonas sp. NW15 TaxID=2922729 RepID=UPI003DA8B291